MDLIRAFIAGASRRVGILGSQIRGRAKLQKHSEIINKKTPKPSDSKSRCPRTWLGRRNARRNTVG